MEQENNTKIVAQNQDQQLPSVELLPVVKQQDDKLISEILQESDVDKLKDLTHLFNAFQTKRQVLRVNALNDVQDALVQQMADRLREQPHNFANADIAAWLKTTQLALDSARRDIGTIDDVPTITYQNNTQINVNVEDTLSRESREKILDVLNQILSSSKITPSNGVYPTEDVPQETVQVNNEGDINNGSKE